MFESETGAVRVKGGSAPERMGVLVGVAHGLELDLGYRSRTGRGSQTRTGDDKEHTR